MSTPSKEDQDELAGALDRIEKVYLGTLAIHYY